MRIQLAHAIAMAIATSVSNPAAAEGPLSESSSTAVAGSSVPQNISIPAGDLTEALKSFAKQTASDLVYRPEQVQGLRTEGVSGSLPIREALDQLLKGTKLRANTDSSTGAILIAAPLAAATSALLDSQDFGGDRSSIHEEMKLAQNFSADDGAAVGDENAQASGHKDDALSDRLEEIVVTAQRRLESLQDVPISISVLGGADLDTSSAASLGEALRNIPGVYSSQDMFTGGAINLTVRGVSTSTARSAGSGPVAYYIDGVPYGFLRSAYVPDPNVYDLDRIEFLRGPQGTLYGAGSLNGTMRVLTHQADVDDFDFKVRSYISMTEDGGQNQGADMAVNVPVVPGLFGARVVLGFRDDSGWVDSYVPVSPQTFPGTQTNTRFAKDINDSQVNSVRLRLRAEPSDTLSFDFSAWHFEDQIGAPSQSDDRRRVSSILPQDQVQEFSTYALTAENEFSGFDLSSTTSFIDFNNKGDAEGTHVGANGLLYGDWNSEIFSQEINLVSNNEGPWHWSVGAFYRHAEESVYQFYNQTDPLATDFVQNDYEDESTQYAVYGEVARDLTETLELAVGLRYFHDDATMRLNKPYSNATTGISLVAGQEFPSESEAVTPRVVLTYSLTKDQTFYASYSQGFRSGIAQQPNVQTVYPEFGQLDPDTLTNYEVGTKGRIGDAFSYEAAIFYIDWQDRQAAYNVMLPPVNLSTQAQVNADSASGVGAEASFTVRPLDGLQFGMNASWNDLRSDADVIQGTSTLLYAEGDRFAASPEWTVGVNGSYEWALGGGFIASAGVTANYVSSPWENPRPAHGLLEGDAMLDVGARFSIENDQWNATLFGDNLTDDYGANLKGTGSPEWWARRRPLTYGVQLEYKF